ncbi:MAG TPA: ATP synthase F1 subunit delta [Rhodothermales bacterium]
MSDLSVARRYARALFEEAAAAGDVSAVDEDVALLEETLDGSKDLRNLLRSPVVPVTRKASVARTLFEKRVRPLTLRFLLLLIDKERAAGVGEILRAYRELRDSQEGVVEASATLALPLGEREQVKLRDAIEKLTGQRVRLRVEQDPGLIGGIVIRVGDTVYDGSVLHQLKSLREHLQPGHAIATGDGQLH